MEYCELSLNIAKEFSKLSSIFMKVVEIQTILNNKIFRHFTEFNEKLQDFMKDYES